MQRASVPVSKPPHFADGRPSRRSRPSAIWSSLAISCCALSLACQGSDPATPAEMQGSGSGGATSGAEAGSTESTVTSTSVGGASTESTVTSTSVGGSQGTTGTVAGAETTSAVSTVSTSAGGSGGATTSTVSTTMAEGGTGGTSTVVDPGTEGDGDSTISPPYDGLQAQDVPQGSTYQWNMPSSESEIYRGDDTTLNNPQSFNRGIRVYIPAQYVDGTAAPLIVVQDGYLRDLEVATNNLIEEGSLPALVLVFVDNGGGDSLGSQRGLEYDTLSDRYSRFITTEVLPAVESNSDILADYPNFHFTTDPEGRGAYGCSSGGAAAFTMGWFTPDQFRRIITYSGTFVDQQDTDAAEEAEYPLGAWEYHDRLIEENDPKPLRVFLQVGENDNGAGQPESTYHNWVMANERMAAALAAQGYHYRFVYAEGAGHCDSSVRQHTIEDTLRWMWRGYVGE